ncbi:DNA polymerase, partial [Pseudomonas syringae]|uniref:DNA polymerase n=2 Tax=Gammaproteobacteria TaxID=1236 RepID=UPI0034D3EF5F
LQDSPELLNILHNVEMPVASILTQMEEVGIQLDPAFLGKLSDEFSLTMQTLEAKATEIAGESFNIASPKQVGEIIFDKLGVKGGKKTASGQY